MCSRGSQVTGVSVKLLGADEMRCPPVPNEKSPLFVVCNGCGVDFDATVPCVCSRCNVVKYCRKECQQQNWKEHKKICNAIHTLTEEKVMKEKEREKMVDVACAFTGHISPKEKRKLVELVGERCLIECTINGVSGDALWDTGAQVSLVSNSWVDSLGDAPEIQSLDKLVNNGQEINLRGAGGKKIPYVGYIDLPVKLKGVVSEMEVPFLVTSEELVNPIIGYNVIKAVATDDDSSEACRYIRFFKGLSAEVSNKVMSILAESKGGYLSTTKMVKNGHVVKKNSAGTITLKIEHVYFDRPTPVMFEPSIDAQLVFDEILSIEEQVVTMKKGINQKVKVAVHNRTDQDITIPARMLIGDISMVDSVTPVEVKLQDLPEKRVEVECRGESSNVTEPPTQTAEIDSCKCSDKITCECSVSVSTEEKDYSEFQKKLDEMELDSRLSEAERKQFKEMLWRRREAFCCDDDDVGESEDLVLKIITDDKPVQKNYIPIRKPMIEHVKNHVADLLNRGWIKESKSPYSSPVVVVRKKGGGLRVCCDYRELNKHTVPDKHPLPRIDSTLENLGGSKWFTVLDLRRAYHQGFVDPESQAKTAFVTPWGLYQWVRIPFGLMNAPAVFQRHMEQTLREYRDDFAVPYIDDIIIYSGDQTDHTDHIDKVLGKLIGKGLKISIEKCKFFSKEVKFLGRIVNEEGYRMDDDSIKAVTELKDHVPSTVGEVRQLLGLVGYHRKQVQDFASIAKPLNNLLKTEGAAKSSTKIEWMEEHQIALSKLIDAITTQPFLAYPDYEEEFFIHTDASGRGLGCILYQMQKGERRVIAYGSRSLLPAEKNYHSTKLEFLALKWAVCDKFRDYLSYADHFTIYTDNNPLLYIMESTKLNAN